MCHQLERFIQRDTNKKIDINLIDKDVEKLGMVINEYIEAYKENEQISIHSETKLKRAIANMSHDLRTPLTSIIGYIQLLKSHEGLDGNQQIFLEATYGKAKMLQVLINDFFELSTIESNEYKIILEKVDLARIVEEELLDLYEVFCERQLKPFLDMPKEDFKIQGNSIAVKRVIQNVLSNAVKYAREQVKIELLRQEDKVILRISNEAQNISQEDVKHIFDRFYIADKMRTGKGTGLGLAITKSLMEKMDGSIESRMEKHLFLIECVFKKAKKSK